MEHNSLLFLDNLDFYNSWQGRIAHGENINHTFTMVSTGSAKVGIVSLSQILEKDISNLGIDELERAMLLYSYIGHAYIWGNLKTDKVIPKNIIKYYVEISIHQSMSH